MLSIQIDLEAIKAITGIADKVPAATEAGLHKAAEVVVATEKAEAHKIQDVPPATNGLGNPKWQQTGLLENSIEAAFPSADTAIVDVTGDAGLYAGKREGLGVDWQPEHPADGLVRKNPFARDTAATVGDAAQEAFVEGFKEGLGI